VMTMACLIGALEDAIAGTTYALIAAAVVIAFGSVVTCITRSAAMAAQLRQH
jgi:F0F1-type ATP synthase assembly protein I